MSIRWKLILTVGLPLLVSFSVLLGIDYFLLRKLAIEQIQRREVERVQSDAMYYSTRLQTVRTQAETLSTLIGNRLYQELDGTSTRSGTDAANTATVRRGRVSGLTASNIVRSLTSVNAQVVPGVVATAVVLEDSSNRAGPAVSTRESAAARVVDRLRPRELTKGAGVAFQFSLVDDRMMPKVLSDLYEGIPPWLAERDGTWTAPRTTVWSEPYRDPGLGGQWVMACVTPIRLLDTSTPTDESEPTNVWIGPSVGVLAVMVSLDVLQSSTEDFANGRAIRVLSPEGRLVVTPDASRIGFAAGTPQQLDSTDDPLAASCRLHGADEWDSTLEAGQTYWFAAAEPEESGGQFISIVREADVLADMRRRLWHRGLAIAVQLALITGLLVLLAIRMVRPLEKLNTAVQNLATGDMNTHASVDSGDEIGQLAGAFNTMVDDLREHVDALTTETAAREKVESELRVAREIQESLLPRTVPPFPDRDEFALHAINRPARHVAGDFYDFFFGPDQRLNIVIADVSGKGVPAAMLMAVTRTLIRNHTLAGLDPAEVVRRVGQTLYEDNQGAMFVTLVLLRYCPDHGDITYVNAGHPYPVRITAEGDLSIFGEVTAAIQGAGIDESIVPVLEGQDRLAPGETLLMFTDGVTEARDINGTMLREAGLLELLKGYPTLNVQELCDRLVGDIVAIEGEQLSDDLTAVALSRP